MSAFIVPNETINKIVAGVLAHANDTNLEYKRAYLLSSGFPSGLLGIVKAKPEGDARYRLGAALLWMNCEAVNYRYPNANEWYDFRYQETDAPSLVQLYKHLRCLLYQCSEGYVPDTDLYKELNAYADRLAVAITETLPAYNAAKWS